MKTFTFEGKNRIYLGARASLIETDREIASEWASKYIDINPAHAWILGKFVESDKANNNQQYFTLEGLQLGQPTINHSPMNVNHSSRNVVGAFVASELIYPATEEASEDLNPYIESLGVFWKYYFPDEYRMIKDAHENASLFFSMECIPRALRTVGGGDDSVEYPYEGIISPNYPSEINERACAINLIDPHFVGGALIIPPVKPGWDRAEVKSIARHLEKQWEMAENLYEGIQEASPELDARSWESMMTQIVAMHIEEEWARTFSADERKNLAKSGKAMSDGSFPIVNTEDLKNAIKLAGQSKSPAAAKAHIKKRAKALGATDLLPENW